MKNLDKLKRISIIQMRVSFKLKRLAYISMLSISEAARQLGVCPKTLRRYESRHLITPYRTPGGHRRYSMEMILGLMSNDRKQKNQPINALQITKSVAIYARVSSHDQKQKGDLQRQIDLLLDYCTKNGFKSVKIYKDVGSGLNTGRLGLRKMFHDIKQGNLSHIIIAYKDRLTRFGYEFIEDYCKIFGVSIIAIQTKPNQSPQEGFSEDIITLMASFSGKLYGIRSAEKKKAKCQQILKLLHN